VDQERQSLLGEEPLTPLEVAARGGQVCSTGHHVDGGSLTAIRVGLSATFLARCSLWVLRGISYHTDAKGDAAMTPSEALKFIRTLMEASAGLKDDTQSCYVALW
jgi:hypothetical protein